MRLRLAKAAGGLSGGQRQRLMIARAIASRPRILLFDEATSALDNQTQAIVSRSLEALDATRIVIAHRLSTIVKADRIFVLEAGRVVQSGTYAELMAQEGLFAKLAQRQLV
jgi:ATP-binding cassette subfamily C protein